MDQASIISRCQQGDPDAFEELYRLHSRQALKTAHLLYGQKGIAEDIVQEAFIQCFRSIKKLKNIEAFNSWFYQTLIRVSWRVSSKYQSVVPLDDPEEVSAEQNQDGAQENRYNPEEFLESRETARIVRQAIGGLKQPLKTVIILFYYNHLSIAEIAKVMGCFQGTVKSRLHTAKKRLAAELRFDFTDDVPVAYGRKECKTNA
ncbi:MAG TPA: sigma-70 family RNA polymerase sigma factor [Bacillota bacterium]|nr:sigma-70 family RNA polymerase sigma factor [Bacillota bacterium]